MLSPEEKLSAIEDPDRIIVDYLDATEQPPNVARELAIEFVYDLTIDKIEELFGIQYDEDEDETVIPSLLDEIDEWRDIAIAYIEYWYLEQLDPSSTRPKVSEGNVVYVNFKPKNP